MLADFTTMSIHITDEEFYWESIEEAWDALSSIADSEAYLVAFREYPQWIRDLIAVHWLLQEFDNGGLMQFFLNDTGNLAPDACDGFRHMGLESAAVAVAQALALFGSQFPRDEKDRDRLLRAKVGLKADDGHYALYKSGLFSSMEDALCVAGGPDLDLIYDRMNQYAKEHVGS